MNTDFYSSWLKDNPSACTDYSKYASGESDEKKAPSRINKYRAQKIGSMQRVEIRTCWRSYRPTDEPFDGFGPNFIRTYILDDKTVPNFIHLAIQVLSYSVRMTSRHTDRLLLDGFCPKFDRNLQLCVKTTYQFHPRSSNSFRVIVFTDRQTDRQTHRQTDTQTDRHSRQTHDRHTQKKTDRQT
ncbi:hypothetical protein AVEN_150512-1 [Araneus ventricosus]|uniref:Uncharacterized protein n=1 Tax=Araneus ventricosus TaxID=182803 RepID=A0A4Y2E2A0_ARAVE|nr:hypothetical protein AVEN_150512-1 [Araneus ventricosus]